MGQSVNRIIKRQVRGSATEVFGILFPNPIGLKAIPEKNAVSYGKFSNRMYAFIGIGPLQPDAPSLKKTISQISARKRDVLFNAVLTHRPTSQDEEAIIADYSFGFSMMYDFADLFTIDTTSSGTNKSSPLQDISLLTDILDSMLQLRICYDTYKPIVVTVRPGINDEILTLLLDYCRMNGVDAISIADGNGTADTVRKVVTMTSGRYPVLACCPVLRRSSVSELVGAGASLVIGGTNFFHRGASNIRRIIKHLQANN